MPQSNTSVTVALNLLRTLFGHAPASIPFETYHYVPVTGSSMTRGDVCRLAYPMGSRPLD